MSDYVEPEYDSASKPCFICGNSVFTWGVCIAGIEADKTTYVYFRPGESGWQDDGLVLSARRCEQCGNVQFFTVDS